LKLDNSSKDIFESAGAVKLVGALDSKCKREKSGKQDYKRKSKKWQASQLIFHLI